MERSFLRTDCRLVFRESKGTVHARSGFWCLFVSEKPDSTHGSYRPLSIVSVTDSPVLLNDKYQLFVTIPERKPYRIPKNCDCQTFRVAVFLPCQIEKVKMRQKILLLVILIATGFAANAQRLTIGGYGEDRKSVV